LAKPRATIPAGSDRDLLGSLQFFALIDLFLGPVVMAMVLAVWRQWIDSKERTLDSDKAYHG
jgi:predicted PurR-regulated permease PerM